VNEEGPSEGRTLASCAKAILVKSLSEERLTLAHGNSSQAPPSKNREGVLIQEDDMSLHVRESAREEPQPLQEGNIVSKNVRNTTSVLYRYTGSTRPQLFTLKARSAFTQDHCHLRSKAMGRSAKG